MPELAALPNLPDPDVTYTEERFGFSFLNAITLYTVPQGRSARVRTVYLELNTTWVGPPSAVLLELTDSTNTPRALIPAAAAQPDSTTWGYTWSTEVGTGYEIAAAQDFGSNYAVMPLPLVVLDNGDKVRLASDADANFVNVWRMQYELGGAGGRSFELALEPVYLLPVNQ
jgi:hypothetical protein